MYSDEEVATALHNLHALLLKKKGVGEKEGSDASGDGTGYSLTTSKHYESVTRELKDMAKEEQGRRQEGRESSSPQQPPKEETKKRAFAYSFRLMDLPTRMYLAYGSSLKSEKEAFDRAMKMLSRIDGVTLGSVRLDRYYGTLGYLDLFGRETKVCIIPRSNATLIGSWRWKEAMIDFVKNAVKYLEQYYRRESSESGFAADKKTLGWSVARRREDRIDCAQFFTGLWHNLFNLSTL